MTRYSRSVIPGRGAEAQDPALDRMVFGAKRPTSAAANDSNEPDFLPALDDDEADLLVARSNTDRRQADRRKGAVGDRRQSSGRRTTEYAPLRDDMRPPRPTDESRRGPLLLVGALLIVVVFGVVVWNAYSDGLQSDDFAEAPALSTEGAFKTPPRMVEAAPVVTEPVETIDSAASLDGGPAIEEKRPEPVPAKPVEAAVTPPPSKVTAPPPAPLKAPQQQQAAVTPPPGAKPTPFAPTQALVKPAAAPTPAPVATPPVTAAASGAYKPAFTAYGDHVVQIAATSSEASAAGEWTRLTKAHPELLSGAERFIIEADVGGKTVYRLRVGSFASKADAVAFCSAFKAKGGNCLPAVK